MAETDDTEDTDGGESERPSKGQATMYPSNYPDGLRGQDCYYGELLAFESFRNLGDEWTVLYNVHPESLGQIDFVLLHRVHGGIVVEVKGGIVSFDGKEQEWYSRTEKNPIEPMKKDPFDQAKGYQFGLDQAFREKRKKEEEDDDEGLRQKNGLNIWWMHAVYFPATEQQEFKGPFQEELILTENDLDDPGPAIARVIENFSKRKAWQQSELSEDELEEVIEFLTASYNASELPSPEERAAIEHALREEERSAKEADRTAPPPIHHSPPPQARYIPPPMLDPPKTPGPIGQAAIKIARVLVKTAGGFIVIVAIGMMVLFLDERVAISMDFQSESVSVASADTETSPPLSSDAPQPAANCHLIVIATFKTSTTAHGLANELASTIPNAMAVQSENVPTWAPGQWAVVSVQPDQATGDTTVIAAETAGYEPWRTELESNELCSSS